jgi:hypothetical protein
MRRRALRPLYLDNADCSSGERVSVLMPSGGKEIQMSTSRLVKSLVAAAALSSMVGVAAPASAQAPHIRGTLTSATLTIETAKGGTETIKLAPKTGFFLVAKSDLSAIQAGKFVGITSVEKDGKRVAVEVHVFAEALRGVGEGHYPWDLEGAPNMMTNGNIAKVDEVGADRVLKVTYKGGGEQTIAVPADASVVFIDKATPDQLASGRKVFIVTKKLDDGSLVAAAVVIGAEGVKPPM